MVQVPSSLPLICLFHFMKLSKISEANINFGEDSALVPLNTLNNSGEYDTVGESLLSTVRLP